MKEFGLRGALLDQLAAVCLTPREQGAALCLQPERLLSGAHAHIANDFARVA